MKGLKLTIAVFCHILLASLIFYFVNLTSASPLGDQQQARKASVEQVQHSQQHDQVRPVVVAALTAPVQPIKPIQQQQQQQQQVLAPAQPVTPISGKSSPAEPIGKPGVEPKKDSLEAKVASVEKDSVVELAAVVEPKKDVQSPVSVAVPVDHKPFAPALAVQSPPAIGLVKNQLESSIVKPIGSPGVVVAALLVPQPEALVSEKQTMPEPRAGAQEIALMPEIIKPVPEAKPQELTGKSKEAEKPSEQRTFEAKEATPGVAGMPVANGPVVETEAQRKPSGSSVVLAPVMGGLGPLHLLATTLCSYQPDKPVADENLNQLYARRANVRKSLFDFMSLKFTNLEKLSSRLGYGLRVVPVKSGADSRLSPAGSVSPSHGWPVVGKCTAHDLKLMGEAAWCECDGEASCSQQQQQPPAAEAAISKEEPPRISSNQHASRAAAARAIEPNAFLPSPEQSSVISKILHVSDIKSSPTVESTIYNLNLTQQQLATLEAHATSTMECRRNALRYTKALFNHLAEDQKKTSESWPKLYALISADDCARKRMIDIVTALSGFRTDTTSIRRDNLEFAFAMDDLRTKVVDKEVNVPLSFDKQFIEVEQFLQQSVRLMLSNIDPNRAKLTSMRYRSLMYGSADDQCIELHQRLLAQSYPVDCNPNQFGQLPDVLRMTASSLELWSIEKELSLHTAKVVDYPNSNPDGQQKVKENVNECIANLVSS